MMLINGRATTQIDALDRGLCYGDGLFETLAVIDGRPRLWTQHVQRLEQGCRRLGLPVPDMDLLEQETLSLCRSDGQSRRRAVVKIMLTRGKGGRGYRAAAGTDSSRIIALFDWPDYPPGHADGVTVRWCDTRLGMNPALAGIKHLNRLEQVLARNEWQDDDIAEGLMLDQQDHVIEGTMTNLFIVKDQRLLTARLDQSGVAGIIRQLICADTVGHGLAVSEALLTQAAVLNADEVFLCNSLIGLWPVVRIHDSQRCQDYRVGPVSRHVKSALALFAQT